MTWQNFSSMPILRLNMSSNDGEHHEVIDVPDSVLVFDLAVEYVDLQGWSEAQGA